ncbi:uncharacterized protein LOC6542953 [Drosophila erecta]|uniref:Uncharacterized protein n=1 Tax=Drosophila erecta TaxID=7220 RepID=B3N8D3_DROER|nr:uncharacterized protein LOC6542953 [Drosophila erecta]EDV57320.2 uncharacterized protein Dere_GG24606 [Drosophila erecta]
MKKVLLTKTLHNRPVVAGGSDLLLAKPVGSLRLISIPAPQNANTYIQRKSFKSVYEEIFKLVMRIPDKALTQRVIDAINGGNNSDTITISHQDKQCSCGVQKVDASSQTEWDTENRTSGSDITVINEESSEANGNTNSHMASPSSTPLEPTLEPTKVPKKRGRKRNTCVPKVVKRSAAEMALQEREEKQLTPVITKKKKKEVNHAPNYEGNRCTKETPQRRNSNMSDISISSVQLNQYLVEDYISGNCNSDQLSLVDDYTNEDSKKRILRIMANEFKKSNIMSAEGLLPIHEKLLHGDICGVKRQIFVCCHANLDINDLLTTDGEDCLELALTNDTDPEIISLILDARLLTHHIYENSNTALHLAVINNINIESVRLLMRRIDLNSLLLTNDDGYTVLHLAVRNNQFLVAEAILDAIDDRELGETVYRRTQEAANANERDEKGFAKYYDRACERLELSKQSLKNRTHKRNVINASEARGGNPPLFYAVEGEQEHLCYFLLAHLADPDEENLSGHSPKSYHYEYARTLRINLKVARVMEKVISILNS